MIIKLHKPIYAHMYTHISVSYTHLDVYKRQLLMDWYPVVFSIFMPLTTLAHSPFKTVSSEPQPAHCCYYDDFIFKIFVIRI